MFLRAGWPARVPCNPAPTDKGQFVAITEPGWWGNASGASGTTAPTVEFVSVTNPQGFGRQGCVCGRGMPRPYE